MTTRAPIKRYECKTNHEYDYGVGESRAQMLGGPNGDWIKYTDYAQLSDAHASLEAELAELKGVTSHKTFMQYERDAAAKSRNQWAEHYEKACVERDDLKDAHASLSREHAKVAAALQSTLETLNLYMRLEGDIFEQTGDFGKFVPVGSPARETIARVNELLNNGEKEKE